MLQGEGRRRSPRQAQARAQSARIVEGHPGEQLGLPGPVREWGDGGRLPRAGLVRPRHGRRRCRDRRPAPDRRPDRDPPPAPGSAAPARPDEPPGAAVRALAIVIALAGVARADDDLDPAVEPVSEANLETKTPRDGI